MASMKRNKTGYPGVYYIVSHAGERIYYIRYRKNGRAVDEKVGRQHRDDMTPARASGIRGQRIDGKQKTNAEKRQQAAHRVVDWTVGSLWKEYAAQLKNGGSRTDHSRWKLYLRPKFGNKKPKDLVKLDTDRIRITLLKKKSPQTVKHVLGLLRRIINYGVNQGYVVPLSFSITFPTVDNIKTEDLTTGELQRLLDVLNTTHLVEGANMMKLALFTGMRRGEIFKLKWSDIDFYRGFIHIRKPKGGKSQKIPLNRNARSVFEKILHNKNDYVFPARGGGPRKDASKTFNRIKSAARLPKDFRPMHGLRHLYATMLADSGKVDMYTLQKLLTHKSPDMTQRYAHLRDDALRRASDHVDNIIDDALAAGGE